MTKNEILEFMILKNYPKEKQFVIRKPLPSSLFEKLFASFNRKA